MPLNAAHVSNVLPAHPTAAHALQAGLLDVLQPLRRLQGSVAELDGQLEGLKVTITSFISLSMDSLTWPC